MARTGKRALAARCVIASAYAKARVNATWLIERV
jgi:hypothetical protein